ncbi:MAG TPA: putative toxin-antitoxin system toxin component, PIN family [Burkholderiales bacterium]
MVLRAVLDTNVWLDWLVFDDPCVAPIREAHEAGRLEIVIAAEGEAELARVLAYERGRHTRDAEAQAACLAECRKIARRIEAGLHEAQRARLPVCRDRDDQQFLEAALASGADFLITKDRALLELALRQAQRERLQAQGERGLPFAIVAPADFAALTTPRAARSSGRSWW